MTDLPKIPRLPPPSTAAAYAKAERNRRIAAAVAELPDGTIMQIAAVAAASPQYVARWLANAGITLVPAEPGRGRKNRAAGARARHSRRVVT